MKIKNAIDKFRASHGYSRTEPLAALFDMDGTLYDSMPGHAQAWMKMCREVGLKATPEEFFLAEGRTGAATIDLLFRRNYGHGATQADVERLYAMKSENFKAMPPVSLMPGAPEAVRACVEAGMSTVLVTGSGQTSLISRLAEDYPDAFEMKISSRDVTKGKPDPEPYLRAMQLAGVEPRQAIVVENAPLGVQAGHAAGVFTIGVVTGPIPADSLSDAGADIVFESMEECGACMPRLIKLFGE